MGNAPTPHTAPAAPAAATEVAAVAPVVRPAPKANTPWFARTWNALRDSKVVAGIFGIRTDGDREAALRDLTAGATPAVQRTVAPSTPGRARAVLPKSSAATDVAAAGAAPTANGGMRTPQPTPITRKGGSRVLDGYRARKTPEQLPLDLGAEHAPKGYAIPAEPPAAPEVTGLAGEQMHLTQLPMAQFEELQARIATNADLARAAELEHTQNRLTAQRGQFTEATRPVVPLSAPTTGGPVVAADPALGLTATETPGVYVKPWEPAAPRAPEVPVQAPAEIIDHRLVSNPTAADGIGAHVTATPGGFAGASSSASAPHTVDYRSQLPLSAPAAPVETPASAASAAESTASHAEAEAKSWLKRIGEKAKANPKTAIAAGVAAAAGLGYVALHRSREEAPRTEQSLQ